MSTKYKETSEAGLAATLVLYWKRISVATNPATAPEIWIVAGTA